MTIDPHALLSLRPEGLYCPPGDFFIDPLRAVPRALISHAHADHARPGHGEVHATPETIAIMKVRMGARAAQSFAPLPLRIARAIGEVGVTLFPAGHVLGSAQILLEWRGLRLVFSGDYKRIVDPTCAPFEVVPCDIFITEATFGLPVFKHPSVDEEIKRLLASRERWPERWHLVGAYALGKAQRVIAELRRAGYGEPIYLHGAVEKLCRLYEAQGVSLGALLPANIDAMRNAAPGIVICPPSALGDRWSRKFGDAVRAMASGWMQVKGRVRQRGVEMPLIISDHADWPDLLRTIRETGAREIWITHGQEEALLRWCALAQINARPLHLLGYEGEAGETDETGDEAS